MAKLIHEQKTLKSLYFIFVFRDDYFVTYLWKVAYRVSCVLSQTVQCTQKDKCALNGCDVLVYLLITHARSATVFYWEMYTLGVIYRNP